MTFQLGSIITYNEFNTNQLLNIIDCTKEHFEIISFTNNKRSGWESLLKSKTILYTNIFREEE